jgi:hypothetical protein
VRLIATAAKLMFYSDAHIANEFCYPGANWKSETPQYLAEEVRLDFNLNA